MRLRTSAKTFGIILTALLIVFFTGCGMQVFPFSWGIGDHIIGDVYENAEQYDAGGFTYPAADVDAVEISWRSGKVELVESEKDTLSVSESGHTLSTDEQLHHWLNDRTLYIQFFASGLRTKLDSKDKHLTLELPKGIKVAVKVTSADVAAKALEQKSVFIASMSGSMILGDISADGVMLSSTSGEQCVNSLIADSLEMSSTSGKACVKNAAIKNGAIVTSASGSRELGEIFAGEVVCSTTSGGISFGTLEAQEADIETTSGKIEIEILQCAETNMRTTSGRMRLGLPDGKGAKVDFTTQSGRLLGDIPWERIGGLYVFGDRTCSITAETTSGNLEIN